MKYSPKRKLVLLAVVLVILLAVGGLTYTYLVKKSSKYIYLQAEAKNYQRLTNYWTEKYGAGWELYKLVQGKPSRISTDISGNFQFAGIIGGFINQQFSGVQRGLDQTKLSLVLEQDPGKERYLIKSALSLDQTDILALELFQTEEMTALRLPTIFGKYLFLGNNQFISTIRRAIPEYQGSEEVPRLNTLKHSGHLVEQLQESLLPKYGVYIWSQLTDEMFTLEKVTSTTAQGEQKARKITLQMSAEEIEAFSQGLLAELQKDQRLAELLKELSFEEKASKLFEELSELHFPEGLSMHIMIDEQGNILSRQVDVSVARSQAVQKGVNIKYISQRAPSSIRQAGRLHRDKTNWRVELEPKVFAEHIGSEDYHEQASSAVSQRKLLFEVQSLRQKDTQTEEKYIETDFSLVFSKAVPLEGASWLTRLAGEIEIPRIRGQLKQHIDGSSTKVQVPTSESNEKEPVSASANQEVSNQVDLQVHVDFTSRLLGKQSLGVQLALKNKVQFTDNLLFPMIEKENAIHLAQLSDTEWWQMTSRLEEKLAEWWKRVGR